MQTAILTFAARLLYTLRPWSWLMFHRKPDVPFPLWGTWQKTYSCEGHRGMETAIIKSDGGYYLQGESQPSMTALR
jgi:hypothetical protein